MEIKKAAMSGKVETGDISIELLPGNGSTNDIILDSSVKKRFGTSIISTVNEVLSEYSIESSIVKICDKGALDPVIRARLKTAIHRVIGEGTDWKKELNGSDKRIPAGKLRSNLYVGGTSPSKLLEARFYPADCIVYDLEDSVPNDDKDEARFLVSYVIRFLRSPEKYSVVRVNGIHSELIEEDLKAMVAAMPDAIRIPKVESAGEVEELDKKITVLEEEYGITPGSTSLILNIESVRGAANAIEIALASKRTVAMALGAEDYTLSLGARRTKEGTEIMRARFQVLEACRVAGIAAMDAVFADFEDEEGLKKDLEITRNLGFDGKTLIHPKQISAVNEALMPGQKEIDYSIAVIKALEEAQKSHSFTAKIGGDMIDKPMELRAKRVLKVAGIVI